MKNEPIWFNVFCDKEKSLDENIDADVLIIGGGITGISTAYHLRDSKLKVVLVEMNEVGHGITGRTTGKLTYLQDNIYTKLKKKAKLYYESQKDAINIVDNIVDINNISCDYDIVRSYLFTNSESDINKVKKELSILNKMGVKVKEELCLPDNIPSCYAISVDNTRVIHPLKYLYALKKIIKKNISIYENTTVTEIKKEEDFFICTANDYKIKTKKVVIASHYPFFLFPYLMPLKTNIEKSYISASYVNNNKKYSGISIGDSIKSIRYFNKYFIYLTGTHNICTNINDEKCFSDLLYDLKKSNLKAKYIWSNHDIITEDNLPYIGYISDNLLIATGYNTWGITNGSLAGVIISDLILNNENKYIELFNPKRLKGINSLKYPLNVSYSIKSMVENKIIKNKPWYSNIRYENINGKKIAIYTDKEKKEHKIINICPHMKCSLVFNEVEKTWDCPCHGSKYDIDGNPIIGPSNKNIGYKD